MVTCQRSRSSARRRPHRRASASDARWTGRPASPHSVPLRLDAGSVPEQILRDCPRRPASPTSSLGLLVGHLPGATDCHPRRLERPRRAVRSRARRVSWGSCEIVVDEVAAATPLGGAGLSPRLQSKFSPFKSRLRRETARWLPWPPSIGTADMVSVRGWGGPLEGPALHPRLAVDPRVFISIDERPFRPGRRQLAGNRTQLMHDERPTIRGLTVAGAPRITPGCPCRSPHVRNRTTPWGIVGSREGRGTRPTHRRALPARPLFGPAGGGPVVRPRSRRRPRRPGQLIQPGCARTTPRPDGRPRSLPDAGPPRDCSAAPGTQRHAWRPEPRGRLSTNT